MLVVHLGVDLVLDLVAQKIMDLGLRLEQVVDLMVVKLCPDQ